jgi:Smg protein
MKESMFDVLMYLFENYFYDDEPQPDRDSLETELSQAGFTRNEINKAFDWLEGLAASRQETSATVGNRGSVRVFIPEEMERLDTDCRGFILYLEQAGILGANSRELVIDRVMALESEEVDIETLKWVILMVLLNQPGEEEALASMEDLMFDSAHHLLH